MTILPPSDPAVTAAAPGYIRFALTELTTKRSTLESLAIVVAVNSGHRKGPLIQP